MGLLAGLAGCAVPSLPGPGKVYVDHGADIRGDERRVQEILAAFNQAEEALQTRNLDELMRLYSRDYAYHGLSKDDLRKIWWDLLAHYSRISSTHIVSGIKVMESGGTLTAEVTCTGSLRTTSDMTGERVNIDSWFYEVHRLIYEDGAWRIRGHVGEAPKAVCGVTPSIVLRCSGRGRSGSLQRGCSTGSCVQVSHLIRSRPLKEPCLRD
jgi:hypothetical protein